MEGWLLGQLAFLYTWQTVQPAAVVDKCIEMFLEVIVPGRGVGEKNWWMRSWRSLERTADKASREAEIRTDLWQWDQDHPGLHHELIVRYAAASLASAAVMMVYSWIRGPSRGRHSRRYY